MLLTGASGNKLLKTTKLCIGLKNFVLQFQPNQSMCMQVTAISITCTRKKTNVLAQLNQICTFPLRQGVRWSDYLTAKGSHFWDATFPLKTYVFFIKSWISMAYYVKSYKKLSFLKEIWVWLYFIR